MPIIGKVGRKSLSVRILNISIHVVLLLGAITMVYPFLMMISASFNSSVDSQDFNVVPKYFFDNEMFYKKYVEARHNEESNLFNIQYKNRFLSFKNLKLPEKSDSNILRDWTEFLDANNNYSNFDYILSEEFGRGIYPKNERKFRDLMKSETNNEIAKFNEKYGTAVLSWDEVRVEERDILNRNFTGHYTGFLKRFGDFKKEQNNQEKLFVSLDGHFITSELAPKYRGDLALLNSDLETEYTSWDQVILPKTIPTNNLREHWINYIKNTINIHHVGATSELNNDYQKFLTQKYDEISLLNKTYKTDYKNFTNITVPKELPTAGAELVDWVYFVETLANPEYLYVKSVELDFRNFLENKYHTIENYNHANKLGYSHFENVKLPTNAPLENLNFLNDWKNFVKNEAGNNEIILLPASQIEFHNYLKKNFGDINTTSGWSDLKKDFGLTQEKLIDFYPKSEVPQNQSYKTHWENFVRNHVSEKFIEVKSTDLHAKWVSFLQTKYNSIADLNNAYGYTYSSFTTLPIDFYQLDYQIFNQNNKSIFWELTSRNYKMVLDVMLYNGKAIFNTIVYCLLAIVTALLVNPLAAYAMSRFKLRSTYKILLVLMLTMAFPPMVMGIPNFLIMKKLNLLNTFWALILPGAADGYFIFLLKGFFDSLPKELFESATLDGAGERTIFFRIAMSLSKPIMAVIALGAFNAAYRNFMFAFIVCQDKSMWTMMVHIYQLMQRASAGVGFAALVIAAIPTFAVFVFFQNIIIKGIVVPTEK
jgi:multiple sugar transport system permease protein